VITLLLLFYMVAHATIGFHLLSHARALSAPLLQSAFRYNANRVRAQPPGDHIKAMRRLGNVLVMNAVFLLVKTGVEIWTLVSWSTSFGSPLQFTALTFCCFAARTGVAYWHVKLVKPAIKKRVVAPAAVSDFSHNITSTEITSTSPGYYYSESILLPNSSAAVSSDVENDAPVVPGPARRTSVARQGTGDTDMAIQGKINYTEKEEEEEADLKMQVGAATEEPKKEYHNNEYSVANKTVQL